MGTRCYEVAGAVPGWTEANLPADLEASRERFPTCCQPHGNREGPPCLTVSIGNQKASHHAGSVGVFFRPTVVFAKDRLSRLFFLHCHSGSPHNMRTVPFLHDCLAKSCELRPIH